MDNKPKTNICPKAKRCKHSAECINFDTFRGEYLCFETKGMSYYGRYEPKPKPKSKPKKRWYS